MDTPELPDEQPRLCTILTLEVEGELPEDVRAAIARAAVEAAQDAGYEPVIEWNFVPSVFLPEQEAA